MKIIYIIFFLPTIGLAQLPIADFTIKNVACKNEALQVVNNSINAIQYEWDICQGDLLLAPTARNLLNLGANIPLGIDVIFDGTEWFAFVANQNGNSIIRLDFGTDLNNNTPQVTNLGNIENELSLPADIKIVREGGAWFGFVYSLTGSILSRIDFGNSLKNTASNGISVTELKSGGGSANSGLDLIKVGGAWKLLYTLNNSVFVVNLASLNSIPSPADFYAGIEITGSSLGDLVTIDHQGNYYAYAVSFSNQSLYRITFGTDITNVATLQNLNISSLTGLSPYGIDIGFDNMQFVALISTLQGAAIRVNLGSDPSSAPLTSENLTSFSALENTLKISMAKSGSLWYAFAPSWSSSALYKMEFSSPVCDGDDVLTGIAPELKYTTEGIKSVTLKAVGVGNEVSEKSVGILIENKLAPSVDWQNNGVCSDAPVSFESTASNVQSYSWKVDGVVVSTDPNPTLDFNIPGIFEIEVSITNNEGCFNFKKRDLKIYDTPLADFLIPAGLICTNNAFTFENTISGEFDGNLSFQWLLDDVPVSTDEDLRYTFTSGGDKEIKLQASIPGCSNESVQIVTGVGEGPTVDFTLEGNCLNESTLLTNNSQGAIEGYSWDFGDGQTSTDLNPTVNYTASGNYIIELETLGSNGCTSKKSISHQIFAAPQPNFNTDLPPFSCNGTATQFNDLTPPLTDSNINTWQWNFDDQNASASTQNPQYTYALSGNYNVSLTVTSDQNCVATLNKTITIAQSPTPSITNTPACVETAVVLQETATTTASAWQWQVGNNFYFTAAPSHVFSNPGDYQVSLMLTASNGCVGTATKQINVPAPLVVDFESAFNCVNTPTQFTSLINDEADPVLTYSWNFGTEKKSGSAVDFLYNQSGIKEVQLTALATSGCSYTITRAVTILPEPKADFSFTPSSGPPPLAVTFTNISTDATSFAWKFNDSNNTTSNLNNPSFTFTEVGEYAVDLTAYNAVGCESTVSKLITIAFPFLNATLDNFRIIRNTDGSYLLLTNILNNGNVLVQNPLIEIQLDNTTTLQEIVNRSIVPGGVIDYTFATQISNVSNVNYACVRLLLPNNEALNNTEACLTFNANTALTSPYPNPASNSITVEWVSPGDEQVSLIVNDNLGNVMATENISAKQGLNTVVLQTMDWEAGIYFIRLKSPSKAHYFRTIIAR